MMELIVKKQKPQEEDGIVDMFNYCGKCYETQEVYPFGLCYECWVKYGKPLPMQVIEE